MSGLDNTSYTTRTITTTGGTITHQDSVIIGTNAGAKNFALLGGAQVQPGRQYTFSNPTVTTMTLTPAAGTIDGAATKVIAAGTAAAPVCVTIASDGTNWVTVSS